MSFKEDIRMFQIGEVYNLEPSNSSYIQPHPLGVEPFSPKFKDDNEIDPSIDQKNIKYQYSRSMRCNRGNGLIASNNDTSYQVNMNQILTITSYIRWIGGDDDSHIWMQDPIYFYFKINNDDPIIIRLALKNGNDYEELFENTDGFQFMKIVINNASRDITISVTSKDYNGTTNTLVRTVTGQLRSSKAFNLATDSFIYIGINPDKDIYQPAMKGIIPILDNLTINIDTVEDPTNIDTKFSIPRNVIPLWTKFWDQKISGFLRVY